MPIQVNQVDPATVRAWRAEGRAVIVDVREPHEWQAEHIPGAHLVSLSAFDPNKVADLAAGADKLVLHCRSGVRCGQASEILRLTGFSGEVNRMSGGILGWKAAGFETEAG